MVLLNRGDGTLAPGIAYDVGWRQTSTTTVPTYLMIVAHPT